MKFSMLEKCFNYCSRFFISNSSSNNHNISSTTSPPRILSSITAITDLYLPPNGTCELVEAQLSNDLLFFTKQPFCLKHLSICLPTINLHHCEDILRLCPYLWSLTISTESIPDFETLLLCCEISTHLRLIYTQPQSLATIEETIKIAKKFSHELIEGIGSCSNLKCSFRFQIRAGIAYAWLPDETS